MDQLSMKNVGVKENTNYGSALEEKLGCKKIATRDQLSKKNVGEDRRKKRKEKKKKIIDLIVNR